MFAHQLMANPTAIFANASTALPVRVCIVVPLGLPFGRIGPAALAGATSVAEDCGRLRGKECALAFLFALIRPRFEAFDFLELAGGFLPSP